MIPYMIYCFLEQAASVLFINLFINLFVLNHKVIFDYLFKSSYMPV